MTEIYCKQQNESPLYIRADSRCYSFIVGKGWLTFQPHPLAIQAFVDRCTGDASHPGWL